MNLRTTPPFAGEAGKGISGCSRLRGRPTLGLQGRLAAPPRREQRALRSLRPCPGLRLADEAPEYATFKLGGVRVGHGERTAIGLAVPGIVDFASPLAGRAARLHAQHDLDADQRPALLAWIGIELVGPRSAGRRIVRFLEPHQRAADRSAAIDHADLALLVPGVPRADGIGGKCRRDRHRARRRDGQKAKHGCRLACGSHGHFGYSLSATGEG